MNKIQLIKDMDVRYIEQIFSRPEAPMQIPEYQRTYAWGSDEITDFVNDMKRLQELRESEAAKQHFMGGIVAYELEQTNSIPKKVHYIVDGQQRLITFQLLFSVIRSHYKSLSKAFKRENDDENAMGALNKVTEIDGFLSLEVIDRLGKKQDIRTLRPAPMDEPIYYKVLNNEDDTTDAKTESHKRLRRARNKLNRDLVNLCKKNSSKNTEYFEKLGILLECVKNDCQVIYIVCPNLSDAYELFQVLNDRGKSLTDGDLLKAHTFKLANSVSSGATDISELQDYWDDILSDPDSNVKQFLEQYFRIITSGNPQKRQLYRQYEDVFDDLLKNANDNDKIDIIKTEVKQMKNWYLVFSRLRAGQWPFSPEHQAIEKYDTYRLELLVKILGLKNLSILMASACYQDQQTFRRLLFLIEVFFFRYKTICGGSADEIGATFGEFAHKIHTQQFTIGDFENRLKSLITSDATDEEFKTQLRLNLVFKEGKTKQIIRYFLTYLEHNRKLLQSGLSRGQRKLEKTPVHVVERSSSVEHIYPQKPITIDKGIQDHDSRGDLTNCLGNLTFLSRDDNSNLGNGDYINKQPEYLKSNIWLNQHLAKTYPVWSAENIIDRENWLLEQAVEVFKIT